MAPDAGPAAELHEEFRFARRQNVTGSKQVETGSMQQGTYEVRRNVRARRERRKHESRVNLDTTSRGGHGARRRPWRSFRTPSDTDRLMEKVLRGGAARPRLPWSPNGRAMAGSAAGEADWGVYRSLRRPAALSNGFRRPATSASEGAGLANRRLPGHAEPPMPPTVTTRATGTPRIRGPAGAVTARPWRGADGARPTRRRRRRGRGFGGPGCAASPRRGLPCGFPCPSCSVPGPRGGSLRPAGPPRR